VSSVESDVPIDAAGQVHVTQYLDHESLTTATWKTPSTADVTTRDTGKRDVYPETPVSKYSLQVDENLSLSPIPEVCLPN
jgi:hypothetical protein